MKNNILHVDMDNFFCAVEQVENNLSDNDAIVVCKNNLNSVICCANPKARKYKIKAAMPLIHAFKLCPDLKVIETNIDLYKAYSYKIFTILKKICPIIEKVSIDEWYLDISNIYDKDAYETASFIQHEIYKKTKLKCSIGISSNKFYAKMASPLAKPFNIKIIDENNYKKEIFQLPIDDLFMIGNKSIEIFKKNNIFLIADFLKEENFDLIKKIVGNKTFTFLTNALNFNDKRKVDPNTVNKNIELSYMFIKPTNIWEEIYLKYNELFNELWHRLIINNFCLKTITIIWKNEFNNVKSKSYSFTYFTQDKMLFYKKGIEILENIIENYNIKQIRIAFKNLLKKNKLVQSGLFNENNLSIEDQINAKFKKEIIFRLSRLK